MLIKAVTIALAVSASAAATVTAYIPGLGEFMAATQIRHIKLWFAGQGENWPLAAYELDELEEGFRDIVRLHPVHESSPVPIRELLPKLTALPLNQLRAAVRSENKDKFDEAFDGLTAACNACHEAENYGFNVITRPRTNPFTNQDFSVTRPVSAPGNQKANKQMKRAPAGAPD